VSYLLDSNIVSELRKRERADVGVRQWLAGFHALVTKYEERILLVDQKVAEEWGRMNAVATLPAIDSLLAATAHVHGLTFVTRNTKDVTRTGVPYLNPFTP
jgi:toxin FitB